MFYNNYKGLFKYFYGLGIHVGHSKYLQDRLINRYLLGIRNNYFIIDLKKSLLLLKRSSNFLFHLFINGGSVYITYNINNFNNWEWLINFFFHKSNKMYNSYSYNNFKVLRGAFSNYKNCFILFFNKLSKHWFKNFKLFSKINFKHKISFYNIFLRLLYLNSAKDKIYDLNSNVYWRSLIFLKNFNFIFKIPEALISLRNDQSNYLFSTEFINLKLPIIGISNAGVNLNSFTYPLVSNSSSFFIYYFYFFFFRNICLKAKLMTYNHFIFSNKRLLKMSFK